MDTIIENTNQISESKKSSTSIIVSEISLPQNVEVLQKKTATIFIRNSKKFVLKGRAGEVTNRIKELGTRLEVYSDNIIEKCHLGTTRGVVRGIQNTKDLQVLLNKYFR
jgi:uncharacterized protein YlzI (FlbEa/FlbD family)